MIRLENVSVEYRLKAERVQALRDVNLEITEGSFDAIMGASGSGKTTLIRMLGGLLPPDDGAHLLDEVAPPEEIAAAMELSVPAVKSLLFRARDQLREAIAPYVQGDAT